MILGNDVKSKHQVFFFSVESIHWAGKMLNLYGTWHPPPGWVQVRWRSQRGVSREPQAPGVSRNWGGVKCVPLWLRETAFPLFPLDKKLKSTKSVWNPTGESKCCSRTPVQVITDFIGVTHYTCFVQNLFCCVFVIRIKMSGAARWLRCAQSVEVAVSVEILNFFFLLLLLFLLFEFGIPRTTDLH